MIDPCPEQTPAGSRNSTSPPIPKIPCSTSGGWAGTAATTRFRPRLATDRRRKERRRRVDPTTFEKQYTPDELEFMNAMQHFKVQTGQTFPTHGDVLRIARVLGYRRVAPPDPEPPGMNGRSALSEPSPAG